MIELIEKENGLLIKLTDKEELENLLERAEKQKCIVMPSDILDAGGYIGNNWWDIPPEDIGALTEAPIIGYDCDVFSDGRIKLHDDSKVYWFPDYMIKDPWDTLLEKGKVFFDLAE